MPVSLSFLKSRERGPFSRSRGARYVPHETPVWFLTTMPSTITPMTDFIGFLKDWQTTIIALPTICFAWYTWEVSNVVQAMDRKFTGRLQVDDYVVSFLAMRTTHIWWRWLARMVAEAAAMRFEGAFFSKETRTKFDGHFASRRKKRIELKESELMV